ncbi:centromere-associated protein E isoform X2 [Parambassis ranga]|uniref:Centromere-associated protein E n=1 Tax=Parambassis ranga TaxID=210632 RepID=A0A6P7IP59_9TELE|nr:centromere-associated protein E isoform X2 [Parambassis ranga]
MTEESAVKVCVRVRPLIAREESAAVENAEPVQLYWKSDKKSIHQIDDGGSTKSFSFDRVFTADETTSQLYQDIAKPLVVSTVEGYNGTIFAYGQTSSGKTFTMMGNEHLPGVIPLAVEDVFQTIKNCPKKEFLLRVSYMEIYNETVADLLVDSWKRKPLEVRETLNKNIYVADLTEELVTSPAQALAWIRKGEKNRHYGKTKMNQRSSRSHTIFRMILESRERSDPASGENADGAIIVSHLNLVDLAGSERASQTGAEGARFKEGCNINRSLLTLGQVIKKLTDEGQKGFTNYRDSKLTRILQNSLGGNAKTVIICTITPVTLDETLSTLQFASTAKKMKNDPHVTEVSDDGALLKRYRNEIVDLKRRLQEVTSVTHTTVTEKKVLSQLIQEKDQLQREQEDRIRNLTKLLVTSSNLVPVPKMPKRRVTWGGKMIRLARLSDEDCSSDLSFASALGRKRKADRSCLMELCEDDEDFDSRWEIPEGASDEMEISQSSVTVRSFGEGDFVSPDRMRELSGKVSNLEMQLEMESQQKEEAMAKMETLNGRVAELQAQLETEAQQQQDTLEKMQTTEKKAAELELQLKTEAQQNLEVVEMLELRVADLERQVQDQSLAQNEDDKRMRRDFAETIQLCETLTSEKDIATAERDYLKQQLEVCIEQSERLEKEKAALLRDLMEKREMDEFTSLEVEFRNEHEDELKNEISCLKKAVESSELLCLELQKKLETVSEQLKKKSEFADELQTMNGKDLVQEVVKLRRSLDDAEGVSRDTKKEWAVLRSQNIALEEMSMSLTANHDKMEAEVNSLRYQLETEKSRYKKMQSDLQKELNVAFEENTTLTSLLDGKVPKHLRDSVELERSVANLNKELTASREAEEALRAQLEELSSFQGLPDKVDSLTKQVSELTEELFAVQSQRDNQLSVQAKYQEEAQQLRDSLQASQDEILRIQADLSAAALREEELSQQCATMTQQLESLHSEQERSGAEKSQLIAAAEEKGLKLEESDQHRAALEEKLNEMQQLIKDLEEKLADSEVSRTTEEEIGKELQEQLNQLNEELQSVQAEKDALLSEQSTAVQSSAEEELRSTVTSLTAERDQLHVSLQEHVDMAAETQVHLQSLQEELHELKQKNSDLVKAYEEKESDLAANILRLSQELQCVQDENEALLKTSAQSSAEEVEKLLSTVASLTEERDQLKLDMQENVEMMIENQEELRSALEKNREQKNLIEQLESSQSSTQDGLTSDISTQVEQLQTQIKTLTEELERVQAERDNLLSEKMTSTQTSTEEMEQLQAQVVSLSEERNQLQEILEGARQENNQLRAELEDAMDSQQSEVRSLKEKLQSIEAERTGAQPSIEEMEKLQSRVTSLTEERDQLQEILEGLRQEKNQLRAELEEQMEMVVQAQNGFNQPEMLTSELHMQDDRDNQLKEIEQLQASLQAVTEQKSQVESELQRSMEMAAESQNLLHSLQQQLQEQNQRDADIERINKERQSQLELQIKMLTEELRSAQAERDSMLEKDAHRQTSTEETQQLLSTLTSLTEERDQLQEMLEALRQEKNQLKAELEDQMEMMQCELQQQFSSESQSLKEEQEAQRLQQIQQLEEHLEKTKEEVSQLKSDLQENVELMIENQEELRVSQEKIKVLHEEINMLRGQKVEMEGRASSGNDPDNTPLLQELKDQIQRQTEELQSVRAERDGLLSERTANLRTSTEELEKLHSRVTSVTEEREQLQEILEGLRQEKQQLRAELEDRMETQHAEMAQLNMSLQTVTAQKRLLEDELQQSMNMVSSTQELLKSVQEELCEQKNMSSDLKKVSQEKESSLDQEIQDLTKKLESVEAERNVLLSEKEAHCQTSTEEMEELQSRVTSLIEERGQLQEILEGLMQEKKQLTAELEDTMETLQTEMRTLTDKLQVTEAERDRLLSEKQANTQTSAEEKDKLQSRVVSLSEERDQMQQILEGMMQEKNHLKAELEERMELTTALQEKLSQQEQMRRQQQTEREEQESMLQQEVQKLGEQLHIQREKEAQAKSAADSLQQLLSESNTTISALREQLGSSQQSTSAVKAAESSQLQDSTGQLQESFGKFQHFIETCSKYNSTALDNVLRVQCSLKNSYLASLPKPTMDAYSAVCQLEWQTIQSLIKIQEQLHVRAVGYKKMFEELVKNDLAVFEERRLQDVLLCRAQAPSYSVKEEDFHTLWEHRLTELLDKRKVYLQKMSSILEKLWANLAFYLNELKAEIQVREKFKEQLQAQITSQPVDFSGLDGILSQEQARRSAVEQSLKRPIQGIIDEQNGLFEELKQVEAQADSQLREERSKNSTILRSLEGAPLKTELSLLKDNQKLVLQLQQAEERVQALNVKNEQLEEAQLKANNRVSNHKQATQLLQTELEDSRALVEEKENTIQTLKSKLRESEKKTSPSAVELDKLQSKLLKMEVKLSSASDEHQQEIQRMNTLLNEKEDSLRKLKETLRKSQQEGEESFLQGEDLHARLTNPRGVLIKSSVLLEKTKLEEEVKQLQLKITELESLVSSQQAEISKWKSRAIKLKVKTKAELNKPSSPCTPTKRVFPMTSDSDFLNSPKKFVVTPRKVLDSPRKVLDSPRKVLESPRKLVDSTKVSVLDSPKSRFFDAGGSSELLSKSCPKQFFDNSGLGTLPDAAVGADRREEWWPQSPKQEEMCKTQ